LRLFKYVLLFFEEYCGFGEALYRENLVRLPKPEFFMLCNEKKELMNMVKFEYDEKVALEIARKEGREEGISLAHKKRHVFRQNATTGKRAVFCLSFWNF
jgi:hypothetical protein